VCGDTERTAEELPIHVEKLNQITDSSSPLEEEFKVCIMQITKILNSALHGNYEYNNADI